MTIHTLSSSCTIIIILRNYLKATASTLSKGRGSIDVKHETALEHTHLERVYESHDLRPVLQLPEGVDL